MEIELILIGSFIFLVSAMLQGLSGFGFSILAIPLITLFISPRMAVPVLILFSIVINIVVLYSTWKEIKGLQMAGRIRVVNPGLDAIQVLRAYLKKYPFTKEFFKENISMDLDSFAQRFGVKLYRFIPTLVYYLDNQIRFAFREEVTL